jgi:hemerythrin
MKQSKEEIREEEEKTTNEQLLEIAKKYGFSNMFVHIKSDKILTEEIERYITSFKKSDRMTITTLSMMLINYYSFELAKKDKEIQIMETTVNKYKEL